MNIAIDGPAGAGKSTVAQLVAKKLGLTYIDTGAMYRALTWLALEHRVSPEDESALLALLDAHPIAIKQREDGQRVMVGNRDATDEIRRPEVTRHVSTTAKHAKVRERMTRLQRQLAERESVVMDGRDIGTRVLVDAGLKIFLTASIDERAKRRYQEWLEKGYEPDLEALKREIAERDKRDEEREHSPLKRAEDAILIDTSNMSIDQTVHQIVELYRNRTGRKR